MAYDFKYKKLRTAERMKLPPFPLTKYVDFLKQLSQIQGELVLDPDAIEFFDQWIIDEEMKPVPYHPRLASYVARRQVHWLKIAMARCLAEGSGFAITKKHLEQAKADLLEMETMLPEIFRDMSKDSDSAILDEVKLFLIRKGRETVFPERQLIQFLMTKVAQQKVGYFIDNLVNSGYITESADPAGAAKTQWGNRGFRFFSPGDDLNRDISNPYKERD